MTPWFRFNGTWHALREGKTAWCGLEPVDQPSPVTPTEDDPLPPSPCSGCLLGLFRDEVEDEPIEVARARGFEPVEPLD